MARWLISILITILVGTSVLASTVVPHHHHHGEENPCFIDDYNDSDKCENHKHNETDDCCNLKQFLTINSPSDSRREFHCDCHDTDISHTALLIAIILPFDLNIFLESFQFKENPYLDTYKSTHTIDYKQLRAPPVV